MAKAKKINLSLNERMVVTGLVPTEGKFEDLIISEDIKAKVSITGSEVEEFEIKTVSNGEQSAIQWNVEKIGDKEWSYDFSELEKEMLKGALTKASEDGKLHVSQIALYKKFVN